jgi:hypothetical protein
MPTYLQLLQTSADVETSFANWGKGRVLAEAERLLGSIGDGSHQGSIDIQRDPAYAYGVLLASSASGAVGGTIGGKLVTATAAGGDANTADLIAAAILADTTANKFVSAQSRVATGTITIASGAGVVTATIASLLPGQRAVTASVTWATSDTATAAALAAAINALPNCPVVASSAAGVVTLWATTAGSGSTNTGGNLITLAATGTGVTVSGALLTGGGTNANVLVKAIMPGTVGAGITLAASGTGITAPTGANLVGSQGAPGNSFSA